MGILITVMGLAILVVLAAMFLYLTRIEKLIIDFGTSYKDDMAKLSIAVQQQFKDLESRANPPAFMNKNEENQKITLDEYKRKYTKPKNIS